MSVVPDFNEKQIQILLVQKPICRKGFDGTSIRNIAKEAKINIAMVSYLVQKNVYWNHLYFIELKI
jgi:hypothetical protein